jgi:CHASE2 domain-containing sensor protein
MMRSRLKRLKRICHNWKGRIAIAVGVWILVSVVRWLGWLQPLELLAFDRLIVARPLERPDERIVIVGVTEADIRKYQQYPFSDAFLADLLQKIQLQKPRVIGLDLIRDIPVAPESEKLTEIFKITPNLIGVGKIDCARVTDEPHTEPTNDNADNGPGDNYLTSVGVNPILWQRNQVGDIGIFVDDDGTVRRGFLYPCTRNTYSQKARSIPSLALAVTYEYLEKEEIYPTASTDGGWLQLGETTFYPFRENDGSYIRANDAGYQILINWRGPAEYFQHVSVADVMDGRVAQNLFRDRLVLIGATAPTLSLDAHNIPYSKWLQETPKPMYGVEIQANLASQFLSAVRDNRPLIQVWPELLESLWILGWTLLIVVVGWVCRSLPIFKLSGIILGSTVILTLVLIGIVYVAFLKSYWIPVVPSLLSLWGAMAVIIGYIYINRIEQSNILLLEANATLEAKVEARTLELSQKNQELEQTLQELRQTQEKLIAQERLSFLGRSVAGVSHELGGLLNYFSKNQQVSKKLVARFKNILEAPEFPLSQKLEEAEKIVSSYEFYLEDLKDSIQIGKAVLEKFLPYDLNRHLNLEGVPIEIARFTRECFDLVETKKRRELLNQEFQLQEDYEPSLKTVTGIPSDFSMVLMNLIDNAWDAVIEKQKQFPKNYSPRIILKTQQLPEKIQIIIQDNGIGVAPHQESEIFKTFFSTKPQGAGIGLGLSLARDLIVARYQGDIYYRSVETEEGRETQFVVEIPLNFPG